MRQHVTTKVKISEEMTRVAKCPFKAQGQEQPWPSSKGKMDLRTVILTKKSLAKRP